MKITFLKDHLEHKKYDTIEVTNERGNYFISTKVAVESKPKKANK